MGKYIKLSPYIVRKMFSVPKEYSYPRLKSTAINDWVFTVKATLGVLWFFVAWSWSYNGM
jgi:hypothetical protein